MKSISTHVLDIARGGPAADISVHLERQEAPGNWRLLAEARTNQDGRCNLTEKETFQAGLYRLVFETGRYFAGQKIESLYPTVAITFQVHGTESQFHLPLLLSPNGYTTYRGT
jgi:5-hydroxyisourate hydrolase